MSKIIPLHSLVFCREPNRLFSSHEIIHVDELGRQLLGDRRQDFTRIVHDELRHQVALKLSLGERVVVDLTGLTDRYDDQLVSIATNQGASVHLISTHPEGFNIEPIPPTAKIKPVSALPRDIEAHLRQWQGLTVIGDVHGNLSALERALAWAKARQHFVWFLGDVIDYGQQTLETSDLVYHTVMQGDAAMVLANHERKIARWLNRNGDHLRLSDGNKVTINALQCLNIHERDRWTGRFRALLAHTTLIQEIGNITLVHGAAHPSLWTDTPYAREIERFALYGEEDHSGNRYRRAHNWVNEVPKDRMVIVGHDIVSHFPTMITGTLGGSVVFLDTGCSKGGHLSSADLRFTKDGLHLECFRRY